MPVPGCCVKVNVVIVIPVLKVHVSLGGNVYNSVVRGSRTDQVRRSATGSVVGGVCEVHVTRVLWWWACVTFLLVFSRGKLLPSFYLRV